MRPRPALLSTPSAPPPLWHQPSPQCPVPRLQDNRLFHRTHRSLTGPHVGSTCHLHRNLDWLGAGTPGVWPRSPCRTSLGPVLVWGDAPNAGFAGSDRRPVGRTQCFWGLQAMPGFRVSLAETRRRASSAQGGALWPKAPRGGRGTPRGRGRGPSWVGFSLILQNNCHSTVTAGGG